MSRLACLAMTLTVLVAGGSAAAPPVRAAKATAPPRLLVFVGEQLSYADKGSIDCGRGCISLDGIAEARYRPLHWIEGGPEPGPIDVTLVMHSQPIAVRHRTALLFVFDGPHRQLARYQIYAVDPTADGRWALCGDFSRSGSKLDAQPIAFRADVVIENVSRWPAQRIAKQYPAPTYELRGDEMHCARGIYAEDLAQFVAADILADHAES